MTALDATVSGAPEIISAAIAGESVTEVAKGTRYLVRTPNPGGGAAHATVDGRSDDARYDATPSRTRGEVVLHHVDALIDYVNAFKVPGTALYANIDTNRIVAVINGPSKDGPDAEHAGWGDHRATLEVRTTTQWDHWTERDGKIGEQSAFADHIEIGLGDIVTPDAATVLEIAQTFHATVGVTFRQQGLLDNGQRQFTYAEDVSGTAGTNGELTIPKELTLGLAPYKGLDPYAVTARLRYRVQPSGLAIGYHLVRPDDVLERAFSEVTEKLSAHLDLPVRLGDAPTYR